MKRAVIILVILILLISPVSAFSFKEFFGKIGNYITGKFTRHCEEGYTDNYRCNGNYLEREYVYEDCSREWWNWKYCPLGCSNNKCNDYHKECVRKFCQYVEGVGEDECSGTSDCYECNDTDGGVNYYEFGDCEDYRSHSDFCLDNNLLREYYCRYNVCNTIDFYCKDGCANGECLPETNECEQAGGICSYDCPYGYIENEELTPHCRGYIELENGKEPIKPEITGEATYIPGKEIKCCIEVEDYCDYNEDCVAKYEYTLIADENVTINNITLMMYGFDYEKFTFELSVGENFTVYGKNLSLYRFYPSGDHVWLVFTVDWRSIAFWWPDEAVGVINGLQIEVLDTDEENWVLVEATLPTSTEDYIYIHDWDGLINLHQITRISGSDEQEITIQPILIQPDNNLSVIRTTTEETILPKRYWLELNESVTYGDYVITFKDIRRQQHYNHGSNQYLIDVNGVSEWVSVGEFTIINGLPIKIINNGEGIYIQVGKIPSIFICESNKIYRKNIIEYECNDNHQCSLYLDKVMVEECSDEEYCLNGYDKCLPDNPSSVEITDDNRFIINNEPTFILGHWVGGAWNENSFDQFKDTGLNLLITGPGGYYPENVDDYMRRCAFNLEVANNLGIYAFIGVDNHDMVGMFGSNSEIRDKVIGDMINCSYRAPAFIGRLNDEPALGYFADNSGFTPDEHNRLFADFKNRDPYGEGHIMWINHAPTTTRDYPLNKTQFIERINLYNNTDVKSIDIYPKENSVGGHCYIPPQGVPEKISCVGEYVDILREATNDEIPVGMTLLGGRWRDIDPTTKERRFMAYQAIVHGATALTWWQWGEKVIPVTRELSSINGILASENVEREVVNREGIRTLLKNYDDKLYLIAVNELNESVEDVDFYNLDDYNEAKVLFESRRIFIRNGRFNDNFEDYDVHVYYLKEEENVVSRIIKIIRELFS